jgi:hypothetical protein
MAFAETASGEDHDEVVSFPNARPGLKVAPDALHLRAAI